MAADDHDEFDLDREIIMSTPAATPAYASPPNQTQDPPRPGSSLETPYTELALDVVDEDTNPMLPGGRGGNNSGGGTGTGASEVDLLSGVDESSPRPSDGAISTPKTMSYVDPSFGEIDDSNVMDFFYSSPFYDGRNSSDSAQQQHLQSLEELNHSHNQVEYALIRLGFEPDVYFIVKQFRVDEDMASRRSVYFIWNSTIYEAPNMRSLFMGRLKNCVERLRDTMDFLRSSSEFSCANGRYWTWWKSLVEDPTSSGLMENKRMKMYGSETKKEASSLSGIPSSTDLKFEALMKDILTMSRYDV